MSGIKNIIKNNYYRIRIILIFSFFSFTLVLVASRISYYFVKDLYLNQVSKQIFSTSKIIADNIKENDLFLLQLGIPTDYTLKEFDKITTPFIRFGTIKNIFIFDKELNILIHSTDRNLIGKKENNLLLNKKEIDELKNKDATSSLPFLGEDKKWYLWGFYRFNDKLWLGIQERADNLEKVDDFSKLFWYIGLSGVLLSVFLGWILAKNITKPVSKLVEFSNQIGKGNLFYEKPGKIYGEIKVLADALDKMRNDLQLNQKEKEDLLAQIAHEIRNPLGGIELLANLTKEDLLQGKINPDYLDRILKEVGGLKSLITAFLNYSRPVLTDVKVIDLEEMFKELNESYKKDLADKNVALLQNIELKKIYFDYNHLKRISENLIKNAIESCPVNGVIELKSFREKGNLKIAVADNGNGIDINDRAKLFEPFFTTKKEGTGLGLAISKKLCKENNADIIYSENFPRGSIFTITKSEN